MAQIKLKGNPINTISNLPDYGTNMPDFQLTTKTLQDKTLADYKGKRLLLNIFPSIDTAVCAMSVRQFNKLAAELRNTIVLCISKDLPFAQSRFCAAEGIEGVETLSMMRNDEFGLLTGLLIVDGPMQGLLARAVIILNEKHQIIYTELVPDITQEPNYSAALAVLQ